MQLSIAGGSCRELWLNLVTPFCTQPLVMIMFKILNNSFYIDITCEEVLLGKVLIEMNSFWRRLVSRGMFPSLQQSLPIILPNLCSPHGFFIWRVRRCLVLQSVMSTFHQVQMKNCIGLTMSISLIFVWPFSLVNPTMSMTYPSPSHHVLHKVCFLYFFKVA
jgi:hypothetical protein